MKRAVYIVAAALLVCLPLLASAESHEGSWTGEVVDLACYVAQGARGEEHAGCGKACVKNGQPMGLLTDDGTLVLLAAHHQNGDPYEALKEMAGQMAKVTGHLHERDGMKVVTVTASGSA